jgi:hypothetical protein
LYDFLSSCPCSAGRDRDVNPERFGLRNNGMHFSKYQSMYSDVKSCNLKARRVEYPDTDILQLFHQQWLQHDEEILDVHALSSLDFKTLPETAQVNQAWRQHCKTVGSAVKLAPKLFNPTVN